MQARVVRPAHSSRRVRSAVYPSAVYDFERIRHRARAAFRAISLRRLAVRRAARANPPLRPPSRPSAAACMFLLPAVSPFRAPRSACVVTMAARLTRVVRGALRARDDSAFVSTAYPPSASHFAN